MRRRHLEHGEGHALGHGERSELRPLLLTDADRGVPPRRVPVEEVVVLVLALLVLAHAVHLVFALGLARRARVDLAASKDSGIITTAEEDPVHRLLFLQAAIHQLGDQLVDVVVEDSVRTAVATLSDVVHSLLNHSGMIQSDMWR